MITVSNMPHNLYKEDEKSSNIYYKGVMTYDC